MAINRLMIEWIMDLESEHKIFSESKSIVELGPSDFMPAALKLLHKAKPNSEFEKPQSENGTPVWGQQSTWLLI